MSSLAKLTIKTVSRQSKLSPVEARRNKLLAGINEQMEVAEAAMRGEQYSVTVPRWTKNEAGEKVRVQRQKVVSSWFFERDGGVYIQCKYGSKALPLSKDGNAVFVKQIAEVKGVLETLRAAAQNGELDSAIKMTVSNLKR
jgi:trehalose utilization protein